MEELLVHYPLVIEQMSSVFTSHQFILQLARQYQCEYIGVLHLYRDNPAPFRQAHAQIAQRLHDFPLLVELIGDENSHDIFGDKVNCARWKRLHD